MQLHQLPLLLLIESLRFRSDVTCRQVQGMHNHFRSKGACHTITGGGLKSSATFVFVKQQTDSPTVGQTYQVIIMWEEYSNVHVAVRLVGNLSLTPSLVPSPQHKCLLSICFAYTTNAHGKERVVDWTAILIRIAHTSPSSVLEKEAAENAFRVER